MKWGVIGLKYRPVPCDYVPANAAPAPANPFAGVPPPPGAQRPSSPRFAAQDTSKTPTPSKDAEESQKPVALSLDFEPEVQAFAGPKVTKGSIVSGQIMNGWADSSWYAEEAGDIKGPSGDNALCKKIYPGGAVSFASDKQKFDNMMSMEFWVKTDNGIPDVNINLEGTQVELESFSAGADLINDSLLRCSITNREMAKNAIQDVDLVILCYGRT